MTREEYQQKIEEAACHLGDVLNEVTNQGYDVDIFLEQTGEIGSIGTKIYPEKIVLSKTREDACGVILPGSSVVLICDKTRDTLDPKKVFLSHEMEDLEIERDGRENG